MAQYVEYACEPILNARTETYNGREYVIAEAVILQEGVLPGSDGPLFYSEKEITKNVGVWNGHPVVAPHPYIWDNGEMKHVSASDPRIYGKFDIGVVRNDRIENGKNGKKIRKVDLYFDVQKANALDSRIVNSIKSGDPINVSTGIFTDKQDAVDNSVYNGQRYTHTVHGIVPDHLAVLMDEKGACSVYDGCGINVNTSSKEESSSEQSWSEKGLKASTASTRTNSASTIGSVVYTNVIGDMSDFDVPANPYKDALRERVGGYDLDRWGGVIGTSGELLTGEDGHPQITDSFEGDMSSTSETRINNTWTEAAREASIAARERTTKAVGWHQRTGVGKTYANKGTLKHMSSQANRAVASGIKEDTRGAITSHKHAASLHMSAAGHATTAGHHQASAMHSDAAAAHEHAISVHSTNHKGVRNMSKKCSCGGVFNSEGICPECGTKMKGTNNSMKDKDELVSWLTTNCGCWKETGSETVLNNLSEKQLLALVQNSTKAHYGDIAVKIVKDVGKRAGFEGNYNELPSFIANSMMMKKKKPKMGMEDDGEEEDMENNSLTGLDSDSEIFSDSGTRVSDSYESPGMEDFQPVGEKGTRKNGGTQMTEGMLTKGGGYQLPESGQLGVMNKNTILNALKGLTEEEFMQIAPAPVRNAINEGKQAVKEKKIAVINKLTGHIADEKTRKTEIMNLWKKSMPELNEILKYSGLNNAAVSKPQGDTEQQVLANFFGQGGAPSSNGRPTFNNADPLLPYLDPHEIG